MSASTENQAQDPPRAFAPWSPEDYIAKRVDQYIDWYNGKAVKMKRKYLWMRTAIVVAGVVVPVLVNTSFPFRDVATSVISLLVATFVALESVYHFREQWKNYRSTEQFLSREKVLFLTGEGGYKNSKTARDAFILFVERCESSIEAENASTLNVMTVGQPDAKSDRPPPKRADE